MRCPKVMPARCVALGRRRFLCGCCRCCDCDCGCGCWTCRKLLPLSPPCVYGLLWKLWFIPKRSKALCSIHGVVI